MLLFASSAAATSVERLLAPEHRCSGQLDSRAPIAKQEQTMRCMLNYARRRVHKGPLRGTRVLGRSSARKTADVLRCQQFSHQACGRDFDFWFHRVGYTKARCWRIGENLAWGSGRFASVRSIATRWLQSSGHRRNIMRGEFEVVGVGLGIGNLRKYGGAHVWTAHFGSHC